MQQTEPQPFRAMPPVVPPPRRRWFIGGGVTAGVPFVAASGYGIWAIGDGDHLGVLNEPAVTSAARSACAAMARSVRQVPVPARGATPEKVAAAIRAQNEALTTLTTTVREVGDEALDGDHPAQAWLADWDTLIQLRESYAADVEAGRPATFTLPTVDGIPITDRMSHAGVPCRIPAVITALPDRP